MKILDIDMDYFMTSVATSIEDRVLNRLDECDYGCTVWTEERVRNFLENNLGLSKDNKIPGRIVMGHNESLEFWKELILCDRLQKPFEVIHVDSHADLGLGYNSLDHIVKEMLAFPVEERPQHNLYTGIFGDLKDVGIGDYLLYAIAYRWIERLTYCGNPCGKCNDYLWEILKDFQEELIWEEPVENTIQLLYNAEDEIPSFDDSDDVKRCFINNSIKEPEVPFKIIPTMEDVQYDGDFDYVVMAQSPNYTPASADFIMDIFREYIEEI